MAENRKAQRHSKRLRAVIIIDENGKQSKTHGKTQDVSISGASIISEYNLASKHPVTVCLLLHPGDDTNPPVVVEAKSKIACSVFSSQQGGFRIGVEFVSVAGNGAKLLQKFLAASMATTSNVSPDSNMQHGPMSHAYLCVCERTEIKFIECALTSRRALKELEGKVLQRSNSS